MKQNIQTYLKYGIFLLGILLLLPQCQKDSLGTDGIVEENGQNSLFSKGKLNQYSKLVTFVDELKQTQKADALNKNSSLGNANNFTILENEDVSVYTGLTTTTYTIPILKTNQAANTFSNLVIKFSDTEATKAILMNYEPSQSYLDEFITNDQTPYSGYASYEAITYDGSLDYLAKGCESVSMTYCDWGEGGTHVAGPNCTPSYMWSTSIILCDNLVDPSPAFIGASGGGGNNGSSADAANDALPTDNEIVTTPIIRYETIFDIEGLSLEMTEWLNNNPSIRQELENFLEENNRSIQAKEEVKLTIQAGSIKESDWDYTRTGSFHGQSSLDYVAAYDGFDTGAYTMYKLANGHTLCESTIRRKINPEDANTIGTQNNPTSNFYYVQINELAGTDATDDVSVQGRWYNYKVPPNVNTTECIVCGLEYLLQAAITNTLIFTGRYVIPVEDALILITGEDFDGVESSRAVSGSFIVLEIVGVQKIYKLLKAIKHVDEVIEVAEAVFRYMDDVFKAQKRYVDDVLNGRIDLDELGNTTRKGNYGEMYTDVELTALGYEPLHTRITNIDQPLNHGIDGVYRNPNTGEYLIVESKYNTSQLGNTLDGKQMSDSWINGTTTGNSRLVAEVGEELAQDIVISGYKRVVSRILPNGTNYFQLLDSNANIIEIWFP